MDGIFCPNESTTFGMLRALEDAGRAGKVKFVGFDASEKLVEALGQGKIDGLVVQNPSAWATSASRRSWTRIAGKRRAAHRHRRDDGHAGEHERAARSRSLLAPDLAST